MSYPEQSALPLRDKILNRSGAVRFEQLNQARPSLHRAPLGANRRRSIAADEFRAKDVGDGSLGGGAVWHGYLDPVNAFEHLRFPLATVARIGINAQQ